MSIDYCGLGLRLLFSADKSGLFLSQDAKALDDLVIEKANAVLSHKVQDCVIR